MAIATRRPRLPLASETPGGEPGRPCLPRFHHMMGALIVPAAAPVDA